MPQIPQLQIPQMGAVSGGVDFAPLGQLGQIYQKAQQDQANKAAIAAFQQTGDTRALLGSGDMSLAKLGAELEQQKAAQAYREKTHADTVNYQNRSLAETARYHTGSLANQEATQKRLDAASDPTKQAQITVATEEAQRAGREKAAIARKMDPANPSTQAWILTGKMPREDAQPLTATDKKAILDADEAVSTNQAAIDSLTRASGLSSKAYSGLGAGVKGSITSQFGNATGEATEGLSNEVLTNALSQLKSTFGGAPTEGERKILVDLQGSLNQTDAVRQEIYKRARTAAEKRLEFNRQRAEQMRGGTYYKPQGGAVAPPTSTASSTAAAPVVSPTSAARSPQDTAAAEWATANPNDPRAAAIKQRLGIP